MPTPLYIDFDDTLVSTRKHLKEVIFDLLCEATGFSREVILENHSKIRGGLYSPALDIAELHLDPLLAESIEVAIMKRLAVIMPDHVYDEAHRLLSSIDRNIYTPILITYGDPTFQEWKVSHSTLEHEFSEIHYVTGSKAEYLKNELHHQATDHFLLIDDSVKTLQDVKAMFPDAEVREHIDGSTEWLQELKTIQELVKPIEHAQFSLR